MFSLDDPRVENFLTEWLALGEHQFGQFRNQKYFNLEEYKFFINKCKKEKVPAFISVQPVLKITRLFFEFDSDVEIDEYRYDHPGLIDVWIETLKMRRRLMDLGAEPIIFYSGRRGYHIYASTGRIMEFSEEYELQARDFYSDLVYYVLDDKFPTVDTHPLHINAMCRLGFSYHQKTDLQVIPLTPEKEPYFPDIQSYRENGIDQSLLAELLGSSLTRERKQVEPSDFEDWDIRECIMNAAILNPTHEGRLALALDAIYANKTDEEIHEIFQIFSDYNYRLTQKQINHTRKAIKRRGIKPTQCETLKKWGICDLSCKQKDYFTWGDVVKSRKKEIKEKKVCDGVWKL
jgi:hypothetical protein